jgi:orotate phosphoribosyltransferase
VNSADLIAHLLLDIKAAHFNGSHPFVFTSGTLSPVYVDCRKLISFPRQRDIVVSIAAERVEREFGRNAFDYIAGGETAGIPFAAWIASKLNLPMLYVRKATKGFGRDAQIEGALTEGASVLLVEDLLFDAKSKIHFCNAIRKAGGRTAQSLVVFDYDNPVSRGALEQNGIGLIALTNWPALLEVGLAQGYFSESDATVIRAFLKDPVGWGHSHRATSTHTEGSI